MKATNEVRVGGVVLAAMVLLIVGYLYFRGVGFGANFYYVRLEEAASISPGAEVRLQGIKVGVISRVSLDPLTQKPLLVLAVNHHWPPYQLRKSYVYSVTSASLLGDQYMDIRGPVTADYSVYKPDDPDQIISAKTSDFTSVKDDLVNGMQATMQQLTITLQRINAGVLSGGNQKNLAIALQGLARLSQRADKSIGPGGLKVAMGDEKTAAALRLTLENSATAAAAINRTAALAGQLLAQNRERTNNIFANLQKTSQQTSDVMESLNFLLKHSGIEQNAPQMFASLKEAADNVKVASQGFKSLGNGQSQEEIQASLASLRQSSDAMRDATLSVKSLLTDPTLQGQFKDTFASLQVISKSMEQTSDNLNQASAGLKNVLGDVKLQEDLKASASELHDTLASTSAAADRINGLLGGRKHATAATDSPGDGATVKKTKADVHPSGLDFTYRYLNHAPLHNYGDLTFNSDLFGGPFRLGLSGIGEDNSLTLQTGKYAGNGDLRYGLYRSKLGVGADYAWKQFSVEGNLWDPNHASWNAYVGVRLSPRLQVLLGQEKFGNVRSTALGVTLSR